MAETKPVPESPDPKATQAETAAPSLEPPEPRAPDAQRFSDFSEQLEVMHGDAHLGIGNDG
ncbi:hypothetical protein GPX89_07525 [Nocardia sp. ET3-3]|uniref:Uncharacterized protein n=1 Tax=Nocardia terrae TaxID=2675851 RepID=A0A7K1URY0_9NOCA|nr:hypothetical protein [Nocardia terrae]MVU77096.1 hypothetical protein [Nocardia terrae]